MELYEVVYETSEREITCRFGDLDAMSKSFGLNKRELTSYITSIRCPKFESVVKSIKKISIDEAKEGEGTKVEVVFD